MKNKKNKDVYITITGLRHYYGSEFLLAGMKLKIRKDPHNKYDREAIEVRVPGLGKIGYVANSVKTVKGETLSAGRLYDMIKDKAKVRVEFVLEDSAVCKVCPKSLKNKSN